jgi:uncharacterized membrane protein YfcA
MDVLGLLLFFLCGCVAGFLAGLFGIGGGIVVIPVLLYYFHSIGVSSLVATHLTFGTSLFIVLFTSLSSAYQYSRNGHVVWRAVLFIGLASVAGALLGASIAARLEGWQLQRIFSIVVTIAAVRLMVESRGAKGERTPDVARTGLLLAGLAVGLVSSLAGVGGGVLSVPMMYYLMKFPLKKALGTSSATIVITVFAASIGYALYGWQDPSLKHYEGFTVGYVDVLLSIPVIIGTIPMAKLGASVAHRTHVNKLRTLYAVFLFVIATKMFFFS